MKTNLLALAIALGAFPAMAMAQQKTYEPFVKAPLTGRKIQVATPWNLPKSKRYYTIDRVGDMSSQPWTRIAERQSDSESFFDAENTQPKFRLLSLGAEPMP